MASSHDDRPRVLLAQLWHHLSRRRRRQFVLLAGLMVISAFAELISLSALIPFLGILTVPERVLARPAMASLASSLGITSAAQLVLPLTLAFAGLAVLAGVIRTVLLWSSTRLAFAAGADISTEVYRRTLYQPYTVHVSRNSSEVISGITSKVHDVVFGVLVPLLTLISSTVLVGFVAVALVILNPAVALLATSVFGLCYVLMSWVSRRRLRLNSEQIAGQQTEVIKCLQEGLGGIRDVLLEGAQALYCDTYSRADSRLRHAQGSNVFISQGPRFGVEALSMVLIAVLAYVLSRQSGGLSSALPLLGALALGAQRLLPAMQQSHNAWANIVGYRASLADALVLLEQPLPAELLRTTAAPLQLRESIRFDSVRFRYSPTGPWILDDFNLSIRKGTRVGIVGTTGSGKSTALDILMGLLLPTQGALLIDGRELQGDSVRAWQRNIAHVPQSIYLADASVARNIAFGAPDDAIDLARVRQAARKAQIAEFFEGGPLGYDVLVGERGIRLSGGQRQRIGIARALYKQASVLVFDEATSALDSATEHSVMEAINGLDRELTIIMIAHRLTTLRHCDVILQLDRGRIVAQGSYTDLIERDVKRQPAHATSTH